MVPLTRSMDLDMIFEKRYRELVAWCRRHAPRRWGDPEDLIHQAYVRCRRHWSSSRSTPGRGPAYVYRAIRWVMLDTARAHRRRRCSHDAQAIAAAPARTSAWPTESTVAEIIAALTPRQRAICRRFLRGDSHACVCAEFGLTRNALAVHLSRARSKLMREVHAF